MKQNNIKPQELRIGNWVQYENRYFQIDSIAEVFPTLNTDEFGIGVVDYNNIKPIPLSEEVLLKAGFYHKGSGFYCLDINDWSNIQIHFYKGESVAEISVQKHSFVVKCKYHHQLQNLYYSLLGEELEVSWT